MGPIPTRSVRFQSHATSVRPRQRVSNLTGRLPGLAREIFRIFRRAVSPPPRGFEAATTCSLARAPRLLWESLALYNRRTKQSLPCPYTGLRIPLVRCGLRGALIRHISSHDKMSRIVIRDLFVVNRDTKNHDSRQKYQESCFFSSLRMALNRRNL